MNYRVLRKLVSPLVNLMWPTTIINREKFVQCKGVYVCNHYSIMDANPMLAQLFTESFRFLVKEEVHIGLRGKFLDAMGGIPVKRGEGDMRAIKECMSTLKQNKSLLIFPEGMRNKDGVSKEMLPLKDGPAVFAIKAKAPIFPMLYYKSTKLFHRTYLIIGDSIDTNKYAGKTINEARELATGEIYKAFEDLRAKIDDIVENKHKLKAAKKASRIAGKQAKKAAKVAMKLSRKAQKGSVDAVVDEDIKS